MQPDAIVVRDAGGLGDVVRIFAVLDALVARGKRIAFCVDKVYEDCCQMCPSIASGAVQLVPWTITNRRGSLGPLLKRWGDVPKYNGVAAFDPDTPVIDLFCPALIHEVATHGRPSKSRIDIWAEAAGVRLDHGCVKVELAGFMGPARRWRASMSPKPLVALAPSSNASIRTWRNGLSGSGRVGRIGGLIHELRARGFATVAFSSERCDVPADHESVDPDIRVQAARLAQCDIFIGPDTGMLHIAAALGMPIVTMFGPTDARLVLHRYEAPIRVLRGTWGPDIWRRVGCDRPCYGLPRGGYNHTACGGRCQVMEQVTEEMVANEAEKLMKPLVSLRRLTKA